MISNLDGADLRAFMAGSGGRTTVTIGRTVQELETGRSGVITSFSSSGPTAFGHDLKPDISAPGGQILSSTLANIDPSRFAVFDGTSMATPHVSGAAALLLELHPAWTPEEVKSALVSTAASAWADTARTQEAPVTEEGGGLVWLPRAIDPLLFTAPASLSFEDVDALHGATEKELLLDVSDAGGGSGLWSVGVDAQSATAGATLDVPGTIDVPPGGTIYVPVAARTTAGAVQGEDYGFVVLKQGSETRRIPYLFYVDRPGLAGDVVKPLEPLVSGTTGKGTSRVSEYRFPAAPFGNDPDAAPMDETGAEQVYSLDLKQPVANAGVSVLLQDGSVDPFFLGALDESSVQAYAGTPVDVNSLTYDYGLPISAAGTAFPRVQRFYVAVDSGLDSYTGQSYAGSYILRSWTNDVTPPSLRVLTGRVTAGRPTIAVQTLDAQSGVDPYSLVLGYRGVLVAPLAYDPLSGLTIFVLPRAAPALRAGRLRMLFVSSDFQEAKNIETTGNNILPNTRIRASKLRVVRGPTLSWLSPASGICIAPREEVLVSANAAGGVKRVRFLLDGREVAKARPAPAGLWSGMLRKVSRGRHMLEADGVTRGGRGFSGRLVVHRCP